MATVLAMLVTALSSLALAVPGAGAPLPAVRVDPVRTISPAGGRRLPARLQLPGYDGQIGISVRGRFSRRFPKRSYGLELQDAKGENLNASLLGMPADDDWVLYSPYNDRTLLRNVLAYDTARWMGRYAARTRFVELFVGDDYQGVYVLMEKLKLHDRRVRTAGKDGFLLELTAHNQAARKDPSFRGPVSGRPFVWDDPERADLKPREAAVSRRAVARVERALYRGGNWRRHLDVGAAVDFALVNEIFKNEDGFHASTFMSGQPGGKLRLGPVWDFDISMGNSGHGPSRVLPGWMLANRWWAERLYRDRGFARAMQRRFDALQRRGLRTRLLQAVDATSAALAPARARDAERWPAARDRPAGASEAHIASLRSWLVRRLAWLDRNLPRLAR